MERSGDQAETMRVGCRQVARLFHQHGGEQNVGHPRFVPSVELGSAASLSYILNSLGLQIVANS